MRHDLVLQRRARRRHHRRRRQPDRAMRLLEQRLGRRLAVLQRRLDADQRLGERHVKRLPVLRETDKPARLDPRRLRDATRKLGPDERAEIRGGQVDAGALCLLERRDRRREPLRVALVEAVHRDRALPALHHHPGDAIRQQREPVPVQVRDLKAALRPRH
jgi:hypothetical protein